MTLIIYLLSVCLIIRNIHSAIPTEWEAKIAASNGLYSPDDDGDINQEGYPQIYLPLIGNGYISHSKGVRSDTYFISGVFNNETTSPSHRARIPATFAVQISNSQTTGTLLDLVEGIYSRRGDLDDASGWYELRWYAHMSQKHLYIMELDVHLHEGHSTTTLDMKNNAGTPSEDIHFNYSELTIDGITIVMECGTTTIPETPASDPTGVCIAYTPIPTELVIQRSKMNTNHTHSSTFITAACTSLDVASPVSTATASLTEVSECCVRELSRALRRTSSLRPSHIDEWATVWQSGIEITLPPPELPVPTRQDVSIAINASLFAILSSIRSDWPYGLAPGGLTNYYNGHSFWDTETWMYPPLLVLHPSVGQSLISYRFNRLAGAREKARSYDPPFAGTMFPWESAYSGVETCPVFADTGLREQHISADISLATWQYWSMTHDKTWLKNIGMPILVGVADFLVSKAVFDADNTAHIRDVIPPDEYVDHVNDSVYTNYGAKCALRFAVAAAEVLGLELTKRDTYLTLAEALVVLVDEALGVHPEYEHYNGSLVKQADVVLLHYPWNMPMSTDMQKSDLEYYSTRTDENGPAMTWGMHSIGYKDLNLLEEAAVFFNHSFQLNMQAPFMVWTETPTGNAGRGGGRSIGYVRL